jgi:ubiquinone/menaquinone biosynthesis C-methylase UbiE
MKKCRELILHGIHLHKHNKFQEAFHVYKSLIELDAFNYQAYHYLGVLYLQTGQQDIGVEYIEKAISIAGSYTEADHNLNVFGMSNKAKIIQEINSINKNQEYPKLKRNTIGHWRMKRMIDFAKVFSIDCPNNWITIGDAYGHDALLLQDEGVNKCIATNLDATYLKLGHEIDYIESYDQVNAERIQFDDASFAFALCKEALHHMPRPYLAIYEMLRIAQNAVFIVEPLDQIIDYKKPKDTNVKREFYTTAVEAAYVNKKIKYSWGKGDVENNQDEHTYEIYSDWYEDGAFNYAYTLSEREIRKITYGMGLPGFAFKKLNDIYDEKIDGLEISAVEEEFQQLKDQIKLQDMFCQASGKPEAYIICILFKIMPDPEILKKLIEIGYTVEYTPTIFMPFKFEDFSN